MKTNITTSPDEAALIIKSGGIVAFPTETVYGLGANVFDEAAVGKIFVAKKRPADNPLIAHIADIDQVGELTAEITKNAEKLIDRFFPGPLTIVLRKSESVPLIATAGLDTIGVRMPRLEIARIFLAACETPVVAPSANLSGRPSPTTWEAVYEDLEGRIDCILRSDSSDIGIESTVVDCSDGDPVLLRQGAISLEQLQSVIPETSALLVVDGESVRSPGLRHRHYSPKAQVKIVDFVNTETIHKDAAYIGLDTQAMKTDFAFTHICDSVDQYARSLFEFFRECDRRGIKTIYCEEVTAGGIGTALMDRIRRAAES